MSITKDEVAKKRRAELKDNLKVIAPNKIPRRATFPMVVCYAIGGSFAGELSLCEHSRETWGDGGEWVTIGEIEVTLDIPLVDEKGIRSKAVEILEEKKKKIQAEAQRDVWDIEEKIQALLSIEHKPKGGENE